MDAKIADYRATARLLVAVILGVTVVALWEIQPSGYQLFTAAALVCILIALVLVVAEAAKIRAVFTASKREAEQAAARVEAELATIRADVARPDINQFVPRR